MKWLEYARVLLMVMTVSVTGDEDARRVVDLGLELAESTVKVLVDGKISVSEKELLKLAIKRATYEVEALIEKIPTEG